MSYPAAHASSPAPRENLRCKLRRTRWPTDLSTDNLGVMAPTELTELVDTLRDREIARSEATLQADIRQLLIQGRIGLEDQSLRDVLLETPAGERRRIDIEIGSCVIEVKKSLARPKVVAEASDQLEGYLQARSEATGLRYVGILTDGETWICFHLRSGTAQEVTRISLADPGLTSANLLTWLEGVLATARDIAPTPQNIRRKLGSVSSAYQLDRATLAAIYADNANAPTVVAKRRLWARLLTTALGTGFEDDDDLFIEHTLLVLSAEIVAHSVLGLDPRHVEPTDLVSGALFTDAAVHGVVEADFFDWVVEVESGAAWVRTIARRLTRFAWDEVEHDVLKVLYESVISAETRRKLGEYYTPDWLAARVVAEMQADPLEQRMLDPSCGSGTFLFHAIRRYLAEADRAGYDLESAIEGLTERVMGMDLHPVAVTLARVTYILAIGRARLTDPARGLLRVPVYLGDSLQWQLEGPDLWSSGNLTVRTDSEPNLFDSELLFPDELLESHDRFDELVDGMARLAGSRDRDTPPPNPVPLFDRLSIPERHRSVLQETYSKLCHLSDADRDHIWSYYVRNLARPAWLSRTENRVDVLVGNPPWLAFRNMTSEMQAAFRAMSGERGLWQGAEVATHQDLSALFIARCVELYLRNEGQFGMVVPNALLDRGQYAGFRDGSLGEVAGGHITVSFGQPWDLRRLRPHFFPRGSAVVFGRRASQPGEMPSVAEVWSGRIDDSEASWAEVAKDIVREPSPIYRSRAEAPSHYRAKFHQGAALVPRALFFVEPALDSPLGVPAGHRRVRSSRSANEKPPWKELASRTAVLEAEFVHPMVAGQVVLPFRIYDRLEVVIPVRERDNLAEDQARLRAYPRVAAWWDTANQLWADNRKGDKLSLADQLDYRGKLSKQLVSSGPRVIYSKSGMHMVACRLPAADVVVNDSLYWAEVASEDEALFLCTVLNSHALTMAVRPLMSYGKDERHFDKYVWQVGIPTFDADNPEHGALAEIGRELETFVGSLEIPADTYFVTARTSVREAIAASPLGREAEALVEQLLAG